MIEIIYTQKDGKFAKPDNSLDTLYIDAHHFEYFLWLHKKPDDRNRKLSTHWRLFEIDSNKNKQAQNLIAIDLDQIKKTGPLKFSTEHLKPVIKLLELKKDQIGIVFTGFGYHIYMFFDEGFDLKEEKWLKNFEKGMNKDLKPFGLKVDSASFKPHQTLRVPGSLYHKPDFPKYQTKVIICPETKLVWKDFKKKFGPADKPLPKKKSLNKELKKKSLKEIHLNKNINWNAIMGADSDKGGCRFLISQYRDQNNVSYQEWLAQLTLTSRYNKNDVESYQWAKEYSKHSEKFNEQDFFNKYREARSNMYPATCKQIKQVWKHGNTPDIGCINCPYLKLNMPLNITTYPCMDTGFRFETQRGPGQINYEAFSDWIIEQHLIQAERDETIYRYKDNYWQQYGENQFISDFKKYIDPQIKPNEINNVPKFLRNHRIFDMEKERAKTKDLIFFKNAVMNLKTGNLSDKFKPDVKNFYTLNFDYDEHAESPTFKKILDFSFMGKDSDRQYFLMFIAASLFTEDNLQKALILLGDGANGKSKLIYSAQCMFPEESGIFTKLDLEQIRKEPVMLAPVRRSKIAYCSDESPFVFNKNINILKQLISNEEFVYRQKWAKNTTYFKSRAKIIMGMNALPIIGESTFGMKRRFSFLDFENQLKESEFDQNIDKKLEAERAGIFNVYYKALKVYKTIKNFPKISDDMLNTAVYLGDIKEAFWTDRVHVTGIKGKVLDPDPNKETPLADRESTEGIWSKFLEYKGREGDKSQYGPTRRMFTEWLLRKKVRQDKNLIDKRYGGRVYIYGMNIKEDMEVNKNESSNIGTLAKEFPF